MLPIGPSIGSIFSTKSTISFYCLHCFICWKCFPILYRTPRQMLRKMFGFSTVSKLNTFATWFCVCLSKWFNYELFPYLLWLSNLNGFWGGKKKIAIRAQVNPRSRNWHSDRLIGWSFVKKYKWRKRNILQFRIGSNRRLLWTTICLCGWCIWTVDTGHCWTMLSFLKTYTRVRQIPQRR